MYKLRQEQELNDKAILRRKDINEPPRGIATWVWQSRQSRQGLSVRVSKFVCQLLKQLRQDKT